METTHTTDTLTPAPALPLRAGTWSLDPQRSTLGFTIRHLGITKVHGSFTDFDVSGAVGETLADTSVTALVQTASIDTGITRRDDHLRSGSKAVSFDVELVGLESGVDDKRQHARFAGRGEVRREDFGLDFPRFVEFGLSQVVKIELDLQLVEGQRATDGS